MSIGLGYRPGVLSAASGGGGAGATPYTLTSITDIPSGAVDGEAGELNGRIYVLATLTKDAGAGGGTYRAWVPQDVLDITLPVVHGYLLGTEADDAARLAHGISTTTSGGGTVTGNADDGGTVLGAPIGTGFAVINTAVSDLVAGSKIYLRAEMKITGAGTSSGTGSNNGALIGDGTNLNRLYQIGTTGDFALRAGGGSITPVQSLRSDGAPLSSSVWTLVELFDEGRTVLSTVFRDCIIEHVSKRNIGSSAANYAGWTASNVSAPAVSSVSVRNAIVIVGS